MQNEPHYNQGQTYTPGQQQGQTYTPGQQQGQTFTQQPQGQSQQGTTQHWTTPGPYTGVGPSNFQISDQQIQDEVCRRLTQHGHLNARNIQVSAHNGIVTLRGSVPSRQAKRMAEDTAESVQGVRDVENNLSINPNMEQQTQQPSGQQPFMGSAARQPGQQLHQGMLVVGTNGNQIGTIKEVQMHSRNFLVNRSMQRDIYIPFSAIQSVQNQQVVLNIPANQVDNQDWPSPSM